MFTTGAVLAQSGEVGVLNQVFFITEAWMNRADDTEQPAIRPSQDPQRKEILLISSMNVPQGKQTWAVMEMIRDQTGHLAELRDHSFNEEGTGENRLLTAFVVGFTAASKAKFN